MISALIRDGFDDVAARVGDAAASSRELSRRERLHVLTEAYRSWAMAQPHRYLLIAGPPLPGYDAPADTVQKARAVMSPILAVFAVARPGTAAVPLVRQLSAWADREPPVAEWVARYVEPPRDGAEEADDAVGVALAGAIMVWSRLQGALFLEVAGHFTGMGFDPHTLLHTEMETLADLFGLA